MLNIGRPGLIERTLAAVIGGVIGFRNGYDSSRLALKAAEQAAEDRRQLSRAEYDKIKDEWFKRETRQV